MKAAMTLAGLVVILGYNADPPSGMTGAPFDNNCNSCHSPINSAFNGTVSVSGLPSTIAPNTNYNLTFTETVTAGSPVKGGYQLVVVQGNNNNCGTLIATDSESGTETSGGRTYIEHRDGKAYAGGTASWSFDWTSPASSNGNTVKFYFIGNFTNGNGNSNGDRPITGSLTLPFAGGAALTASITSTTPLTCNGSGDGTATAQGAGGAPPYSYAWPGGQTTQTAVNLAAGTYICTVSDANNSTATASATVTQPTAITTSVSAPGTLTCLVTTLTATATASGGSPGYTYSWSNGNSGNPTTVTTPGSLTVTVTDTHGCTKTATVNVAGNVVEPNAVANATGDITCIAPNTIVSGSGSSVGANFTYLWTGTGIISGGTTLNATVNQGGNFTLKVTNTTNGCTNTAVATVIANNAQPTAVASSGSAISCSNPSTTVTVATNAGSPTFSWTGPNGFTSIEQTPTVTAAGTYNVTVTNSANGCTKTASTTVTGNTTTPSATATGGTLSCSVTTVQLTATTNATGATFAWTGPGGFTSTQQNPTVSTAGTYTVVVTNPANGCTNSATASVTGDAAVPTAAATGGGLTCTTTNVQLTATTNIGNATFLWAGPGIGATNQNQQNPSVNTPGNYTVTVTNPANGCTNTATTSVSQNTTVPGATASGATITCANPMVVLNGNSTTTGVTYAWTGPNSFTSSLQNPTVSVDGGYNLVVTDPANGCTSQASANVDLNIVTPGATATGATLTCTATSVVINGSSTTGGATFAWTGPGGFTSSQQNPTVGTIGGYNLVVTNPANGCTSAATAVVNQNIAQPTASVAAPGQLSCNATSIQLNATASSQGTDFTYLWTTADGNIQSGGTTLTPVINAVGGYSLLITNTANGSTAVTSTTVSAVAPVSSAISGSTNISCNGGSNGSATVVASGGTGNFTYLWSNGQTTTTASNLSAGSYSVTATDATGGCTTAASATVTQPDVLAANATATAVTFNGGTDGTATAAPSGGTPNFTYLWSNGGTTQTITGLAPGTYSVVVTDANGCTAAQTVTVNSFGCAIAATGTATNVTCFGAANGTATANTTGANQPVTYLWSNGGTTQTISGLAPGDYACSILDNNGCPAVISVSIAQPAALAANASATAVTANGATDGTATAQPTGGTGSYTYLWNTGATTQSVSGLAPGSYSVVVTDANGCTAGQSVTVNAFNCAVTSSVNVVNVTCFGLNNGQATAILVGGTAPFTYLWPDGQTTATATNLAPGTGTVSISDAAGCPATADFTITQPTAFVPAAASVTDNVCLDGKDGQITVNLSGGTPNYTYLWSDGQTVNPAIGLPVGNHTCTVTDANGCAHVETNSIKATDNVAPTIACPASVHGCDGLPVDEEKLGGPVFSDNCSLGTIQPVRTGAWSPNHIYPIGTTTLGYTITDALGNTASCDFSIEIHPNPGIAVDDKKNDVGNAGVGSISVTLANGPFSSTAWQKDGAFFSNSEDLTGLKAGDYVLVVTSAEGCSTTSAVVTILNTVGTDSPAARSLRVLPNPTADVLRIETEAVVAEIRLTDSRGGQVLFEREDLRELDLTDLPAGIYFLQIRLADGSAVVRRVVKI